MTINFSELSRVIDQVGKDRGIKREVVIEALEQAMLMAAQKKLGPTAELEAHWNDESGEVEVFQFKKVVETEDDIYDDETEIDLERAHDLDPETSIGDELGIKLDAVNFGRIDAHTAKQIIFQKVREAEREIIYNEFSGKVGQIVSGIARRAERGNLVIDLGKTEAHLPRKNIIPGETFRPGDRVQALLEEVKETNRGPQLVLSRTAPLFLVRLYEMEVPEIAENIVEIRHCVREPGERAKFAVISNDRDVDPVGACVGMKGIRVQNVVQELKGEKIDIIPWNEDITIFVCSALAPAEISMVKVIPQTNTLEVIVEDDQLSLAIGRRGQNVRLASQLTGWKVDILSKTKLAKRTRDTISDLKRIDDLNDTLAQSIYNAGVGSMKQLAGSAIEDIIKVPGFETREKAAELLEKAKATYDKLGDYVVEEEQPAAAATSSDKGENAKYASANEQLKAAFAEENAKNQDALAKAEAESKAASDAASADSADNSSDVEKGSDEEATKESKE